MEKTQGEHFARFIEDNRQSVCRRIMYDFNLSEDDAKDIYQESAIALYKNIHRGINGSMEKFFSGIWYRQALKYIRKNKRIISYDTNSHASETNQHSGISFIKLNEIVKTIPTDISTPQSFLSPDEAFDLKQMKERVASALDAMALRCRQLLTKYYLEGYNWAELATQFGLSSADSAKASANKCRRRFEERYKELEVYIKG